MSAPNQSQAAAARETMTVACKLPHGLVLRLFDMVDEGEPQRDGSVKTVKRARQRYESGEVVLNGYVAKHTPGTQQPSVPSSYALTHNVPAAFFAEWMEQNKDSDLVRNKLIFGHGSADRVSGFSREHDKTLCGLEPIDPSNLPRGISTYKREAS